MNPPPCIVFTDLDGTLLDHDTYSAEAALPGLHSLQKRNIPVIFCSAKTRAEQLFHQQALHVRDPLIVENGGAIVVPKNYFKSGPDLTCKKEGYQVLELASSAKEVRNILKAIRQELNLTIQGYADLNPEQVAERTGLDIESAARARQREYSETIVSPLEVSNCERLRVALADHGLKLIKGARFHSVSAANDKGRAVQWLTNVFRREWGQVFTVGIGDSYNDVSMLEAVDSPLLVQRPGGTWADLPLRRVQKIEGVGPFGWTKAIELLLSGRIDSRFIKT